MTAIIASLLANKALLGALAGAAARELSALPGQILKLAQILAAKTKTTADDDIVKAVQEAAQVK